MSTSPEIPGTRTRGTRTRGTPTRGTPRRGAEPPGRRTPGTPIRGTDTSGPPPRGADVSTLGRRRTATALFIGALALAGAGLALARVPAALRWDASTAGAWAALTCAIAVLELFPIRIRYRT